MTLATIPYRPTNGQPEDISQIIADFDALLSVLNGQIGMDNFTPGQIVPPSKLTNEGGAFKGGGLQWDGAKYVPAYNGIHAKTIYAPATNASLSTTSTSPADIDAVNLKVDFWPPQSGAVIVEARLWISTSIACRFTLREGSTDVGTWDGTSTTGSPGHNIFFWLMAGLATSPMKTYKLGWANLTAGTTTVQIGNSAVSTSFPPAWILVHPLAA